MDESRRERTIRSLRDGLQKAQRNLRNPEKTMYQIHELAAGQTEMLQGLLGVQRGAALVFVHPFHMGIADPAITQAIARNLPGNPPVTDARVRLMRDDVGRYMAAVGAAVNLPGMGRVAFVFQGEHQLGDLPHLQSLNPGMEWVVITTQKRNPVPMHGSWEEVLGKMQALGLQEAFVGGFYATTDDDHRLLPTAKISNYGCVNVVVEQMRLGQPPRFRAVHAALAFTFECAPHPA